MNEYDKLNRIMEREFTGFDPESLNEMIIEAEDYASQFEENIILVTPQFILRLF